MRLLRLSIPVALLSLVTACGGSTPTTTPTTPAAGSSTTSASPTAGSESAQVLTGTVGTAANPEAFEITLMDSAGAPVTTLKAGKYLVKVKDLSPKFHNFHLKGTGVEEKTELVGTMEVEWTVTFVAGTYDYQCDPHLSNMKKTFTVT